MPNLGFSELIIAVLVVGVPLWVIWAARGFLKGLIRGLSRGDGQGPNDKRTRGPK